MAVPQSEGFPQMVHITVADLTGRSLVTELDAAVAVESLKAFIDNEWGIPAEFQELLLGAAVIDDSSTLDMLCVDGESILEFMLLNNLPYDGDLHAATLAKDTAAVRKLMRYRDRIWTDCANATDWEGRDEALLKKGFCQKQVERMVAEFCKTGRRASFRNVLKALHAKHGDPVVTMTERRQTRKFWNTLV